MRFFPHTTGLDSASTDRGMRILMMDTVFFQMMTVLTSGVILTDFARSLAPESDTLIGILVATPPLCQLIQVPTIALVERLRNRRAITVVASVAGRLSWFAIPFIAMMEGKLTAALLLILVQFWYHTCTYVAGCAISAWLRDLVPEDRISRYFGGRLAIATTASALTLLAVWLLLPSKSAPESIRALTFPACFIAGGIFGMLSSWCIAMAPEPEPPRREPTPLLALLSEPLRDERFRRFLAFNAVWFAVFGMTWQFFPKVLLARFAMPLAGVTVLTMGGLVLNAVFFKIWAGIAEKRGDRAVLHGALPLYLAGLALWPVAELLPLAAGTPLAATAFILCGSAFAGMQLGVVNTGLKFAPRGKAAAYIACNSCVMGITAAISPALGGIFADLIDGKGRFSGVDMPHLPIGGLGIVFIVAIGIGFRAIVLLARVPAEQTHARKAIYEDILAGAVATAASTGALFAPRRLSLLPYMVRDRIRREDTNPANAASPKNDSRS